MRVPLRDLSLMNDEVIFGIQSAAVEVVSSGKFVLGPYVQNFENSMATYLGRNHAIGTNSCTDRVSPVAMTKSSGSSCCSINHIAST